MASQLPMLLGGRRNGLPTIAQQASGNPLLQTLRRTNPTGAGKFFDTIDTYTGAKPLREFITGRKNATGGDVLKQAGLTTGNGLVDVPLSIAMEIALDPTTYMTGGFSAAGKAGRAARAAGLIDDVPRLFSRAAINAGKTGDLVRPIRTWGDRLTSPGFSNSVGARANKTFQKAGIPLNRLTDSDLAARPLAGYRQAGRSVLPGTNRAMTLNDLVKAAPDPQKALDDVTDFLGKNVNSSLNKPVFKDIGIGIPFTNIQAGVNLPGVGKPLAQTLDNLGNAARYSAPGRHIAAKVDKSMLGQTDDVGQLIAKRLTDAEGIKATEATGRVSDLIRGIDEDLIQLVKDPDNGRYLRAAVEGNEKFLETLYKNSDQFKALKNHRQFGKLVQDVKKFYGGYLEESAEAGIKSAPLTDPFGNDYFSRSLDRRLYKEARKGGVNVKDTSVITSDMQQRSPEFNIPGGTGMLNQLSRDVADNPALREAGALADHIMARVKEADAVLPPRKAVPVEVPIKGKGGAKVFDPATGEVVTQTVMQAPEYTKGKAKELANKLLGMDEDALDEGIRLFDQNPFEAIDKYAAGRSRAIGRANVLQDMVAQTATKSNEGTSIASALNNMGMSSTVRTPLLQPNMGAKQNVVESINRLVGKGVVKDVADLGNWKTSAELQRRIKNVSTFYDDVQKQSEFFKLIGAITKNFKVWVLATPRRSVRDFYSGGFSNFITHPFVNDQMHGYSIAKRAVLEQDWEGARSLLEKIPRYNRIKAAGGDVIKAAQDDLAKMNMAQTGKLRDIDPTGQLLDAEPEVFSKYMGGDGKREATIGSKFLDLFPTFDGSGYKSKAGLRDTSVAQEFSNAKNITKDITPFENGLKPRSEFQQVRNPLLRTAARTADVTDKMNRMGGYFAMLKGGYSPESAAKAITEAQIDYSSLTKFERQYLATLFPFWSYQSRVVKWGAKTMYKSPVFKNVALRGPQRIGEAANTDGEVAPSRIAERYGIPFELPDWMNSYLEPLLGKEVPGVQLYLSDIDIPFVDSLNTINPIMTPNKNMFGLTKVDAAKTLGATAQNVAGSMLNPLAKMGVEGLSGQDLFTKTPLDATRKSLPTIAKRLGVADAGTQEKLGYLEPALTSVAPGLNHLLSIGRKISSPKGPTTAQNALDAVTNIGSGLKIERIGQEEKVRDMRAKIANFLEQSPYASEMTIPYIPEERLPYASQELQEMFELDKELQKRQRMLREARVSNNPLLTP